MDSLRLNQNPDRLLDWAEGKPLLLNNRYIFLLRLLPLITASLLLLAVFQLVSVYIAVLPLFVQILTVAFSEKHVSRAFGDTGKAVSELERYSSLLKCIEMVDFQAPLLVRLKKHLSTGSHPSSQQIKALSKIADRMNFRHSPLVHLLLNITTLWDLHTLRKLEEWKSRSGSSMRSWFRAVGVLEALSSLAGLAHDHPGWVFPEVADCPPVFEASSLGHPLLNSDVRVCNDVSMPGPGTVFVITGSNMSGKSTFMRTVGINLVLAYAGAPVCARSMRCSQLSIFSSMVVHDDLEQKISTFYAELKRIKTIVDAALSGKAILFLLDEIFKGTNSRDRIIGAKTLLKKLCQKPVLGLVTTHDLELGFMEKECPQCVRNYHFTDQITGNQISFDYRLKPGISQTTNAIALMKMVGIEVETV